MYFIEVFLVDQGWGGAGLTAGLLRGVVLGWFSRLFSKGLSL